MIGAADMLQGRILIVDVLAANIRLLEQTLAGAGYTHVDSTMNPRQVCALHRRNPYDLILLDLLMPGMDGIAVLEALRRLDADRYVPVLVITAQPGQKLRALQAGAKDFISEPIDLIEVRARIHNILEVRLLYRQIERHNRQLEQTVLERTAELRAREERLRRLTELSCDWFWEQDAAGVYTELCGPALEMLGIGGHDLEASRTSLAAHISARRPFLDLFLSRTKPDGSLQHFLVSGEPIFSSSGRYTGYRGIGVDVTERALTH